MKSILICLFLLVRLASAQLTWDSRELTLDLPDNLTVVTGSFTFSNTGRYPIAFQSIKPGCPCTTAKADKDDVYAPGDKGVIRIHYNPKGQLRGTHRKSVAIETLDETGVTTLKLEFTVNIPQIATIEPAISRWTEGEAPEPKAIRITFPSGKPVKILGQMMGGETYQTEIKIIEADRVFDVMVTPQSTATPRIFPIRLMTDAKEESNPQMPVILSAEARIEPKPAS